MSQQSLCDLKGLEDAGLSLHWKYGETASTISEGCCNNREMDMPARVGACRQGFLLPQFFYLACYQKVLATLMVGLPASNHLTKKIPYKNAQQLVF